MNCPVCHTPLAQPLPAFCNQCAWDLKNDLTLNDYLTAIPESEVALYDARRNLARQNWERIQELKKAHAETLPQTTEQQPHRHDRQAADGQTETPAGRRNNLNTRADSDMNVQRIVANCKIVVDTESFLASGARKVFIERLLPLLRQYDARLLVSDRTIDSLIYQQRQQNAPFKKQAAEALNILRELQKADRIMDAQDPHPVSGNPFDTFTLFTELFIGYQLKFNLCLITQNEQLARQIIANARSEAFDHVKNVQAGYVEAGELKDWLPRLQPKTPSCDDQTLLSRIVPNFKIIADTSSLLLSNHTGVLIGVRFFQNILLPALIQHNNKLLLPHRVRKELEKHLQSPKQDLAEAARKALALLDEFEQKQRLIIGKDSHEVAGAGDTFADPVFVRLGIRFQATHDLCFITQDTNLARALRDNRRAGAGHEFMVTYLCNKTNKLVIWEDRLGDNTGGWPASSPRSNPGASRGKPSPASGNASQEKKSPSSAAANKAKPTRPRVEPFARVNTVDRTDNRPVSIKQLPGAGDIVYDTARNPVRLIAEVAEGGEGKIWETDRKDLVCKVYHADRITESRRKKLKLMISRDIGIREVCWPVDIVSTTEGQFAGYLMPRVAGKLLKTAVFAKPLLKKNFSHWTRIELTQLAITTLRAIQRLHRLNIFIGDINPQNILVQDEHTIAIVDTDSFQVEGFSCPVGTETFTPPERQGMNFAEFLRTEQDELFAVTTLLFMILFTGKAPYSSQGGGEAAENIRNRAFAYDLESEEKPPVGAWLFIWSHLHPSLKYDFKAVFSKGERIPIKELLTHLSLAVAAMRKGERSSELFPAKPWQRKGETVTVTCMKCPPNRANHEISRKVAERLKSENKSFMCSACQARQKLENLDARASHTEQTTQWVDCASRLSPKCVKQERVSITYLKELAQNNRAYWCHECRTAERIRRANERQQRGSKPYRARGGRGPAGKKSQNAGCFIATATFGSDTAPPVRVLRNYRDRILCTSAWGRTGVAAYYACGPWLAAGLNRLPFLKPLLRRLFTHLATHIHQHVLPASDSERKLQ